MRTIRTAAVVGDPKPNSRTLAATIHLTRELTGRDPELVVDLTLFGPTLLDSSAPEVASLVARIGHAELVVFGSPTFRGTYSGLLKLFLERFEAGRGLRGIAVPLMLGASPAHALAPELTLRPVLTEIGGVVPGRGLYVVDSRYQDPAAYDGWLAETRPVVRSLLEAREGALA